MTGNAKILHIADGYTGERYAVGQILANGKIKFNNSGLRKLTKDMHHYNPHS